MGLRAQSLAGVLVFALGVGGLGFWGLSGYLGRGFDRIEQQAMRKDFQRLIATLDDALAQKGRGAREWSHWTALRDYARNRNPQFAEDNLSPASLRASGLSWLAVLSPSGELIHAVRGEPSAGSTQTVAEVLSEQTPAGRALRQPAPPAGRCAWVFVPSLGEEVQALCHLPIMDSSGQGEPAGSLITAERMEAAAWRDMGTRAALDLQVYPLGAAPEAWAVLDEVAPGQDRRPLWVLPGEPQHRMRTQLVDGAGAPAAWVELRWPRELRLQGIEVLRGAGGLLAGLAALLALGAYWLVDLRLVRRLRSLQRQIARARAEEDWTPRLRVRGEDEIQELAEEGNHLLRRIQQQVTALEAVAQTDALTGLANRRAFDPRLQAALALVARQGGAVSVVMVDADYFKRFNDTHGHAAGDAALKVLAQGLNEVARRGSDLAARLGGEEFALLLEGGNLGEARQQAQALQRWLAAQACGPGQALAQALTVSMGVAQARPGESPGEVMARADAALYQAKALGRNRIESAP
ncbi:GGDEF domain-containing protein [Inhella gelatinilytica]|uniref:diguanylate cyclase n=1 Tax=Inhella gelatinilytica TaxID=2795030 RepID=A0A931NCV8_9BURK|nr:diguanylate cyclase [Inhella gelatinilytica]MBH9551630.1 diguanylate cyclase [Inhella gelatinilytica]